MIYAMKPSEEIQSALDGAVLPSEMNKACLSAMSFKIYQIACEVLRLPGNDMKREAIEKYPDAIQTLIRAECRRVYDLRNKTK